MNLSQCRLAVVVGLLLLSHAKSGDAQDKIAFTAIRKFQWDIFTVNVDGSELTNLTNSPDMEFEPAWSPDGDRIAYQVLVSDRDSFTWDVHVMYSDGTPIQNVTGDSFYDINVLTGARANDMSPAWSPDGTRLAFSSNRDGQYDIWIIDVDGANPKNLTGGSGSTGTSPAWSPDGSEIAYMSTSGEFSDLALVSSDGSFSRRLTLDGESGIDPSWSPDGTKLAYAKRRGDNREIWVVNRDGSDDTNLTGSLEEDHFSPSWSADGRQIAFSAASGALRSSDVRVDIRIMDADGRNQVNLTHESQNLYPSWSPGIRTVVESVGWGTVKALFLKAAVR